VAVHQLEHSERSKRETTTESQRCRTHSTRKFFRPFHGYFLDWLHSLLEGPSPLLPRMALSYLQLSRSPTSTYEASMTTSWLCRDTIHQALLSSLISFPSSNCQDEHEQPCSLLNIRNIGLRWAWCAFLPTLDPLVSSHWRTCSWRALMPETADKQHCKSLVRCWMLLLCSMSREERPSSTLPLHLFLYVPPLFILLSIFVHWSLVFSHSPLSATSRPSTALSPRTTAHLLTRSWYNPIPIYSTNAGTVTWQSTV